MSVWGVIPARFGSTRYPGKPLVKIKGLELVAWVIRAAKASHLLDQVVVATDDVRIAEVAKREGVKAAMTDSQISSGTDRIWAAIKAQDTDIVLNIQGDEPLVTGSLIDSLIDPMLRELDLEMATLAQEISIEELSSEHAVKVVINQKSEALYFSRYPIPYSRKRPEGEISGCLKHIGMYAYRSQFLKKFCEQVPIEIENSESLEQLRALYLGAKIKVIKTEEQSWGVDTPQDIQRVEKILSERMSE